MRRWILGTTRREWLLPEIMGSWDSLGMIKSLSGKFPNWKDTSLVGGPTFNFYDYQQESR